ncbi:ADP-ribose pyrophosphatase NudF [Planctomycetes bacterium Poly30]|uniref:ADP-ribose pyrophosphatase NudF n=1 Tax=Saltatorellus ferox TaxID=2528018 RepID=A0A518ENN4_9BACT|nr:ADP-ribose pyrophosphatase NudF [Planctomycetes bacterium Poly30]
MSNRDLKAMEIVEDRTAEARCDQGFLTLRRLRLRNAYSDGTYSEPYPCDVVERPGSDAVVSVLYERFEGRVRVLLREASRAPIYLRREKSFVHPDPREYRSILEVVAGMVEASDPPGAEGLQRRAAAEAHEEGGLRVREASLVPLGGETFASPGTTDEKIYFCAAEAALDERGEPTGDGSVMEEWSRVHLFDLRDAIEMCRDGRIPDMKTEVALLRLADHVGFVPALDCFTRNLPAELQARFQPLGLQRAPDAPDAPEAPEAPEPA